MPKIIDKKKKAKTISTAALKVFREMGYHNTRMTDIAEAASIGKGTIYEYFKDKADILGFAFEDYFNSFTDGALQAMNRTARPMEKLILLVDFALAHAAEWEDHCSVYVDYFGEARTEQESRFSLAGIYKDMKDILTELIEEGQTAGEIDRGFNPLVLAELLVSMFDGIIIHRVLEGQGMDRDLIRKSAVRLIRRGLLGGPIITSYND